MGTDRPKPPIRAVLEAHGAEWVPEGRRRPMQCPYHDDSHSSAIVDTVDQFFKCFACDAKGDAYSLVMFKESCDFKSAIGFLEGLLEEGDRTLLPKPMVGGGPPRSGLSGREPRTIKGQRSILPTGMGPPRSNLGRS